MTRRRALLIGGVLALIAAVGAVRHSVSSTHTTASRSPAASRQLDVGEQNGGVAYGDTAQQVLAKLGAPTKKQSACWIYDTPSHTLNGMYLGKVIDAAKFCFADGPVGGTVVSTIYEHLISSAAGRLPPDEQPAGGWIHAFTIASPGSEHQK